MDWKDVRTLDDLRALDGRLADGLTEKSLDFFYTESPNPNVYWEAERKAFQPERTDPEAEPASEPGMGPGDTSRGARQVHHPARGAVLLLGAGRPPNLSIELPDDDRDDSKRLVEALNVATEVTNAVIIDAASACRREHDQLAADLGLRRTSVGFG